MAEAVAAVGLASNIVQFLDFGTKLLLKGQELYKSADGALKENKEIEALTSDVKALGENLTSGTHYQCLDEATTEHAVAIRKLAKTAHDLADELLNIVTSLKVDRKKKNARLRSFQKSLRSAIKQDKIRDLERRLGNVKAELCLHLVVLLSTKQSKLLPAIQDLTTTVKSSSSETQDSLDQLQSDVAKLIDKSSRDSYGSGNLNQLSRLLTEFANQRENAAQTSAVLQSLHFSQINVRYSDVKVAHVKTCEWIFSKTNFSEWLQSANRDAFWISGKAGSGKSTTMKFIYDDPRTMESLRKWAASQNLFLGRHFFWSAGTPMQKSLQGMLQTLLFQVLSEYPNLISIASPQRWKSGSSAPFIAEKEPWTREELLDALEALACQTEQPLRFCFFIDGLDEYHGDHTDMVNIVQKLSSFPSMKVCVSSRPWPVFRKVYEPTSWTLRVQDLTRADIEQYVEDKLGSDLNFRELQTRNHVDAKHLIDEIVRKAEGVFLWVYLVVQSLLRGLTNQDEISDLRRRLDDLPADLGLYFKFIFDNIERIYRRQSAQTFQMMIAFNEMGRVYTHLPMLVYNFFDAEKSHSKYAINMKISVFTEHEVGTIAEKTKRHIHARCQDLLEVVEDADQPLYSRYTIEFLHRTVHDYLKDEDTAKLLSSWAGPDFNPHSSLCKAFLAHMKAVPYNRGPPHDRDNTLGKDIFTIAMHAKAAEVCTKIPEVELLDDMDRTVSTLEGVSWYPHFIRLSNSLEDPFVNSQAESQDFLDVMVQLRLSLSVAYKLKDIPDRVFRATGLPLLLYGLVATRVTNQRLGKKVHSAIRYSPDPKLVQLLLQHRADPNEAVRLSHTVNTTVWGFFLVREMRDAATRVTPYNISNYFKACEHMIKHGASPQIHIGSVKPIFDKCFTPEQSQELMDMFPKEPQPNNLLSWVRAWV